MVSIILRLQNFANFEIKPLRYNGWEGMPADEIWKSNDFIIMQGVYSTKFSMLIEKSYYNNFAMHKYYNIECNVN